jgi:hypothetical protein
MDRFFAFGFLTCLVSGCSAGGAPPLDVGIDGSGGSKGGPSATAGNGGERIVLIPDAGRASALSAHIESPPGISVEFITLSCDDACADVKAVVRGGYPPYVLSWEDGTTQPLRHVCPSESTVYGLTVTDAGISSSEFHKAPATVQARLTASVIACPDGGSGMRDGGVAGPSGPVTVPGQADIWLAGQTDGLELPCQCADVPTGKDTATANSPVFVPVVAGSALTFSVSGATSIGVCSGPTPDGGCLVPTPALSIGPANGISSIAAPYNALIGVFLDDSVPTGTEPPPIDVTASTAETVAPLRRQVFFIGDGFTGNGTGARQRFLVPAGANRLFLASADTAGGNYNNSGSFTVMIAAL